MKKAVLTTLSTLCFVLAYSNQVVGSVSYWSCIVVNGKAVANAPCTGTKYKGTLSAGTGQHNEDTWTKAIQWLGEAAHFETTERKGKLHVKVIANNSNKIIFEGKFKNRTENNFVYTQQKKKSQSYIAEQYLKNPNEDNLRKMIKAMFADPGFSFVSQ